MREADPTEEAKVPSPRSPERTCRRYEGTRGRMRHRQVYLLTLDHKEPTEEVEIGEDAKECLTQGNEPDKMDGPGVARWRSDLHV